MKTDIEIDGRQVTLELSRDGATWLADGKAVSVAEVEPGIYSVLLGARSYEVRIERTGEAWAVTVGSRRFAVDGTDPRRMKRRSMAPGREGRQRVAAPMPGKVVRLLVSEGELVEAGQGIAVIEAMKMQNELKAPKAGRVISLSAREGATVAAGEVLALVE